MDSEEGLLTKGRAVLLQILYVFFPRFTRDQKYNK